MCFSRRVPGGCIEGSVSIPIRKEGNTVSNGGVAGGRDRGQDARYDEITPTDFFTKNELV